MHEEISVEVLDSNELSESILKARSALLASQESEGHWCFELEADCTIPAEYILMMHFTGEIDTALEKKIAVYLRRNQTPTGGWPLYYAGDCEISCSVKVYYALKLAGDDINASHMQKAREYILKAGGAAKANVFTRITLAMFNQVPWRAVPFIPVEVMLLPKWFPFHVSKVSYWSRTVMVPLLILCTLKARAKNPRQINIQELFVIAPEDETNYFPVRSALNQLILWIERIGRWGEFLIPRMLRQKAFRRAEAWMIERLNGEDGIGAIFPAMVNAYEALLHLGYAPRHPLVMAAKKALEKLLVLRETEAYCQPCFSPVWDTGLAILALQEEGSQQSLNAAHKGLDWLLPRQILDHKADWQAINPELSGGGWAFQYNNPYYPDVDDTAVVVWGMHQANRKDHYALTIDRAAMWLSGMQCADGGYAAFDVDNDHYYLNEIPFADHGALLDPPTSDVSARVLTMYALLNRSEHQKILTRIIDYLAAEQESDGSWFGRWGTNYIYGTWSVLTALHAAGVKPSDPMFQKAITWLKRNQHSDGGWGESNDSYFDKKLSNRNHPTNALQTAWALLGLMAAGEVKSSAVKRGIAFLQQQQQPDGTWKDAWFTSPGFPRVFYLKYHGYHQYFPLWALARYRNLIKNPRLC